MHRRQPIHPALSLVFVFRLRQTCATPSPLVPLKQIPRARLIRHVWELVALAVCDYNVTAGLEGILVVDHLGAEELRRVMRGLIGHHGQSLAFMRFITPWMELSRKLSELVAVRQHALMTGTFSRRRRDSKLFTRSV